MGAGREVVDGFPHRSAVMASEIALDTTGRAADTKFDDVASCSVAWSAM